MGIDGVWTGIGILTTAILAGVLVTGLSAAAADTPPGAGLTLAAIDQSGSYFSVTQSPGSTTTYTVGLVNSGSADTAYSTYASDVYTLPGGGLGAQPGDHGRTGTTTWLAYPALSGSLAAGQTETRTFTISVPERTSAGQYVTSLAIENANPVAVGATSGVAQILRNVIAVSIRVPGKLEPAFITGQATATEVSGQWQVHIPLRNTGNVVVKPAGRLRIVDASNVTIYSEKLKMGSVYAKTSTTIDLALDLTRPHGYYTILFDLTDEDSGVALSKNVSELVVGNPPPETSAPSAPAIAGAVILGVISLSFILTAIFAMRRRAAYRCCRDLNSG